MVDVLFNEFVLFLALLKKGLNCFIVLFVLSKSSKDTSTSTLLKRKVTNVPIDHLKVLGGGFWRGW